MKICITTDLLTERDLAIEVIETFLEVFEKATLVAISFKEGAILGPVELRKITSTSLTHKINNYRDLQKYSFLVPGVLGNHFISCQYDLIINVSRGLSHGFKRCDTTRQITYLLDEEANPKGKSLFEKIFKSFVNKWALKRLDQVDELWVSSEAMKEKLQDYYSKEIIVVPPFIKVQDFPLIPTNVYPHNYYVINAEGIDAKLAESIISIMKEKEMDFRFVGKDTHLQNIKKNHQAHLFLGEKCNGDLSPILAASRGLIDFNKDKFPALSLCALSSGRPVIISQNDFISGEGVFTVSDNLKETIVEQIEALNSKHELIKPEKLHGQATKFHQLKFKGMIQRMIVE